MLKKLLYKEHCVIHTLSWGFNASVWVNGISKVDVPGNRFVRFSTI